MSGSEDASLRLRDASAMLQRIVKDEHGFLDWQNEREKKITSHLAPMVFKQWREIRGAALAAGYVPHGQFVELKMPSGDVEELERSRGGLRALRETVTWLGRLYWSPQRTFTRVSSFDEPDTRTSRVDVFAEKMGYIVPMSVHKRDEGKFQLSQKGIDLVEECRVVIGGEPNESGGTRRT